MSYQEAIQQKIQQSRQLESEPEPVKMPLDERFRSKQFRLDVRTVCEYLGQPPTMATFKKYDGKIVRNWHVFAAGIRKARREGRA